MAMVAEILFVPDRFDLVIADDLFFEILDNELQRDEKMNADDERDDDRKDEIDPLAESSHDQGTRRQPGKKKTHERNASRRQAGSGLFGRRQPPDQSQSLFLI